ncbi:hypothetical protein BGZ67_003233 [Mortierella alpina]|nr:hypothetical protein BGZ67_003233 [Mortierella alpina]
METHHSGLATPPLVSPRPIQTQRPLSADDSWKIVGSPPRRPLLSPPEEREHHLALEDSDITTVEGDRSTPLVGAMNSEHLDVAESTVSSFSADTSSKSSSESSSSTSSPTSPTVPQYSQGNRPASKDLAASLDEQSTPSAIGSVRESSTSPFAFDLDSDEKILPLHFKSSSTGTVGSRQLTSLPEHSSPLGSNSFAPPADLGRAVGGRRSSLKQTGGVLESTPLTLSSFIWSGTAASNPAKAPITESSSIGPLVSIGSSYSVASRADTSGSSSSSRNRSASFLDHLPSHTVGSGVPRTGRSLSFSESSFSSALDLVSSAAGYDQDDDEVLRFRPGLPIMEEEYEDPLEPRFIRARSFSTSAALSHSAFSGGLSSSVFMSARSQDPFSVGNTSNTSIGNSQRSPLSSTLSDGFSAWTTSTGPETALSSHRRSNTSTTCYNAPIWETSGPYQHLPVPLERDRQQVDRQRVARRFSVAPSSGFQNYGAFLDDADAGNSSAISFSNRYLLDNDPMQQQVQRRHSVAGVGGSYFRPGTTPYALTSSFESLHIGERTGAGDWGLEEELHDQEDYSVAGPNTKELGKGLSLGQLPHREALYVVEFKAGRNDLFYVTESSGLSLKTGDLVIVEADRGKDLGKITNDSITPKHIQALQDQQVEIAAMQAQQDGSAGAHRTPKEIHPKRIFRLAQSTEISQLAHKSQDEVKAMMVCQTKVRQKRLPMEVVDAEYQWDRRKLTFYFVAERRIDFRELVRDLFKIYKTRIWMYAPLLAGFSQVPLLPIPILPHMHMYHLTVSWSSHYTISISISICICINIRTSTITMAASKALARDNILDITQVTRLWAL